MDEKLFKLHNVIFTTIKGSGNLWMNSKIRTLTRHLYEKYDLTYSDLYNDFFIHCCVKDILGRHDLTLSKFETYISNCCKNFLENKARDLGRQYSKIILSKISDKDISDDINQRWNCFDTRVLSPEDIYFRRELSELTNEYISTHVLGNYEKELFICSMMEDFTLTFLSDELGCNYDTMRKRHLRFRNDFKNYLLENGYCKSDIMELIG